MRGASSRKRPRRVSKSSSRSSGFGAAGLVGIVDELLDDPAHRLRQAVEVGVERAEARQLDQLLHHLVAAGLLGARLLPLAVELLGLEGLIDSGERECLAHGLLALALQLLLAEDRDLLAGEELEVGLELHPVHRAVHVGDVGRRKRRLQVPRLIAGAGGVDPVREDPLDRVAHHVDQLGVGAVLVDPLRGAVEAGQVRVVGRGLAADGEGSCRSAARTSRARGPS